MKLINRFITYNILNFNTISMKRITLFLAIITISSFAYSQDLEYAKSVVKKLASPELQGRGYTANGNFLAAEFISGEFKRFGLVPYGKSYYQKFNISINTFPDKLSLKINGETLKPGIDYLIHASSPGIKGKFNIIKVRKNEIDSDDKLAALIKKAGDKFILIDETEKASGDIELNKKIKYNVSYLKTNAQIPCKGIIIYTNEKLTFEASTSQNVRPIVIINKAMDLNSFNSLELTIDSKFIKRYETQNVVGCIKGSVNPDSMIVITSHYDHIGQMGKATFFPGANDNASGVAMNLSLAAYYSKNKPKYTMVFIALSGEEAGILGAKAFAANPLITLNKIKFLVNFDMAGTGEEGIKVVNGSVYQDNFDLLSKINTEYKLVPKVDIRGESCNSDHCPFYQKGVPCFFIYTQGGIKAYHDIYDIYETLPFTAFVGYRKLMIKFFDTI